jgi:hypothetical protein
VAGVSYFPDPDVVVKIDYTAERTGNSAVRRPRVLNIGLGWWF